jgi:hypothetical protein
MTRHSLAFTILALAGTLTLPDPSFARASFRPAFATGPFRIVLPSARPRMMGTPRMHRPAFTAPARAAILGPRQPVTRTAAAGPAPSRMRHHRFRGSVYPVTVGTDGAYYGTPYDPSDIPVYAPIAVPDEAPGLLVAAPADPAATRERGCRAQHVMVPMANGRGESEITIVRC